MNRSSVFHRRRGVGACEPICNGSVSNVAYLPEMVQAPKIQNASLLEDLARRFRGYYQDKYDSLQSARRTIENLIVQLLRNGSFEQPKVISRLKDELNNRGDTAVSIHG